ncbi:MAG: type II secretion system GspH family protein [Xanthobacteraceae bacterium]|nr:type II secretion system GspH family protein [Xanthobacteraceae bacterium]
MNGPLAAKRAGEAGFTLIETLVAMALMALVLSALANITSQWLPNWNRGLDRIQRNESISFGLQRIASDLAVAEYVPANREQRRPLFDGSELSVTFVRTALGPNATSGLDVVRIGDTADHRDLVTVRSRAQFAPFSPAASLSEQVQLGDPVVLFRAPFRLSFSYAGRDRVWKSNWHEADGLPAAIMLTVRDMATERVLSVSTVALLHVEAPASEDAENNSKVGVTDDSESASAAPVEAGSQ